MLQFFLGLSLSVQQADSLRLLSTVTLMTRASLEKHTLRISVIIYGNETRSFLKLFFIYLLGTTFPSFQSSTHGLPANVRI